MTGVILSQLPSCFTKSQSFAPEVLCCGWFLVCFRFTVSSKIIYKNFAFIISLLEEHKGAQCRWALCSNHLYKTAGGKPSGTVHHGSHQEQSSRKCTGVLNMQRIYLHFYLQSHCLDLAALDRDMGCQHTTVAGWPLQSKLQFMELDPASQSSFWHGLPPWWHCQAGAVTFQIHFCV